MHPSPAYRAGAIACIIILVLSGIATAGCTGIPGISANSPHLSANDGKLSVYFLDVGQGDSELLRFGNKTILIDAGETDQGDRVVADLRKAGVTRIDLLVATHPHSDHIGGMQAVLNAFPVGQVLDDALPSSSPIYQNFLRAIDKKGITYTVAEQGRTIDLDPSLRILVLSPPEERFGDDPNANSIVLRISYGTVIFLFTGDMGGEAEDALVKSSYPLDAKVLKVGHHGSEYSSSKAFLSRVHPEIAVIEVGKDNPYGHPHKPTLRNLADAGVTVYRTDLDGTILVRSDGATYSVTTENSGSSIWSPAVTTIPPSGMGTPVKPESIPTPPTLPTVPAIPAPSPLPTVPTLPTMPALPTIPSDIPVPEVTLPPVQIGNASSVYISAIQFNAPGDDRENLDGEWIRLGNRGDGPVLIAGWTLSDSTGSHPYTFPAVVLLPGSSVTLFTGSGTMNDTALYMGQTTPVWGNSGDEAILRDGAGNLIDRKTG
jgi:beta-lactamase superfamily II metal-dependent hydrolase